MDVGAFLKWPANADLVPMYDGPKQKRKTSIILRVGICIVLKKQFNGEGVILISSPHKDGGDRLVVKQVKWEMEECDEVTVKGIVTWCSDYK